MLRLEKVNAKNVWEILKLQVLENQKSFVASNNISIIEAYTYAALDVHQQEEAQRNDLHS